MTEFWTFSNYIREKCDENLDTQKVCKTIADKYIENEKKQWRAQSIREENITLKLDIANMESLCSTVIQNTEEQAELDSLLKQFYEEHLRISFDINECEIEKLYSYEEIKIELDTRESASFYQQFYWRKIKMATKMEERKIVKKYRQKEQEFLKSEDERINLEKSLEQLKEKSRVASARVQELYECIYRLVKGSKELETLYAQHRPLTCGSLNGNPRRAEKRTPSGTIGGIKASGQIIQKGGLSSKLVLDFHQFKTPFVPSLPKIPKINPSKGFSRLLQQAEDLRKSMQRNVIALPDEPTPPKCSSILKIPTDLVPPTEITHKTVSFEKDVPQEIIVSNNILDATPSIPHITLDTTISEIAENSNADLNKTKVEIIEHIILKPGNMPLEGQLQNEEHCKPIVSNVISKKRKIVEEDHCYVATSSPKKKCTGDAVQIDTSMQMGSKNFIDMFLEFSKETSTVTSSTAEPKLTKPIQTDEIKLETKESIKKTKDDVQTVVEKKKVKNTKASFDDFDDFFTGFAGSGSDNDNERSAADMSFDFFEGNENTADDGDAGSDNFSFKF